MPRQVFHQGAPIWWSAWSRASERPSAEPYVAGVDQLDAVPERVTYVAAQDVQPAVIFPDLDAGGRESFAHEREVFDDERKMGLRRRPEVGLNAKMDRDAAPCEPGTAPAYQFGRLRDLAKTPSTPP